MPITDDITREDFLFFKEKILALAGIHLTESKLELVRSRVQSYLRKSGMSPSEFRRLIEHSSHGSEAAQNLINILTTNKTDFFREPAHFDFLASEAIPRWLSNGKREINIWCCASSTGEEPYTIAMILDRHLQGRASFKVLASDIDTRVLGIARNGVYSNQKLSEIPEEFHGPYLMLGKGESQGYFKISDRLHSRIRFERHNLIDKTYPAHSEPGTFDLIFCRNVLIYFEPKTITNLMGKLHGILRPDGYLIIGHSESIHGTQHLFKLLQPAIFTKVAP